jgi:hypothetical protein
MPEWLRPYQTKREAIGGALQIGATLLPGTKEAQALMATNGMGWLKSGMVKGAKLGAVTGATEGVGLGLEEAGQKDMNAGDTAKTVALSGVTGAAIGTVTGAAAGTVSDVWKGKNPITGENQLKTKLEFTENEIDKAFGTKPTAKKELKGATKAEAMGEEYTRPQRFLAEEGVIPSNTKQGASGKVWDTASEMDTLKQRASLGAKAINVKMDEVNPSPTNSLFDLKETAVSNAGGSTKNATAAKQLAKKVSDSFDDEIQKALSNPDTMVEMTMTDPKTKRLVTQYVTPNKVAEASANGFKVEDIFVKDSYLNDMKKGFYELGAYETMPDGKAAFRSAGSSIRQRLEDSWAGEGMDLRGANKVLEQYYDAIGFLNDMNGAAVPKGGNGIVKQLVRSSSEVAGRSTGLPVLGRAMNYGSGELFDAVSPDASYAMSKLSQDALDYNPAYDAMAKKLGIDFSKVQSSRASRLQLPEPATQMGGRPDASGATDFVIPESSNEARAKAFKATTGMTPKSGQFTITDETLFTRGKDGGIYMKNPRAVPTRLTKFEANELIRAGYIPSELLDPLNLRK